MNEELVQQLVRQLKNINFWITLFGSLIVITLLIVGFLVFRVVVFARNTERQVNELQQKTTQALNIRDDLCQNSILSSSRYCKD